MEAPRSFRIMVFTKDGKPVNLLNLLNLLTYEDSYKGKMVIFCFHTSWWWRLRRDPSAQVAAVLAFVISHTTFLAAQDDETGRCPKVVFEPLVTRGS